LLRHLRLHDSHATNYFTDSRFQVELALALALTLLITLAFAVRN
jgi:hypothetical protein